MKKTPKTLPPPRSLQEWMERTGTNSTRLIAMVKSQTGIDISPTAMSFILRGSRRCSVVNAVALMEVTGVSHRILRRWPKDAPETKPLGEGSNHAA